jgi:hypothetical protein
MDKLPPAFRTKPGDWQAYVFEALAREGYPRPDKMTASVMGRRVKNIQAEGLHDVQPWALACAIDAFFAVGWEPEHLLTTRHLGWFLRAYGRRPEWLWRLVWMTRKVSPAGIRYYVWWLRRVFDGDVEGKDEQRKLLTNLRTVAALVEDRPDLWAVNWFKEDSYGKDGEGG